MGTSEAHRDSPTAPVEPTKNKRRTPQAKRIKYRDHRKRAEDGRYRQYAKRIDGNRERRGLRMVLLINADMQQINNTSTARSQ